MSFDKPKVDWNVAKKLSPSQVRRYQQLMKFPMRSAFDTWTLAVNITGFLEGELEDWPNHIQDALLKACEQQCVPRAGQHVKIVAARCYQDVPNEPAYLRVVAQAFPNFIA